ncbi:CDP-glycerol glycerophosphotransferase family protein [Neobacillus cucumis]|uniref:CDP-glycerol glycerophosphotransferase family protein n=1 Tax=Neobacillus cucumis TaxID=1740721 RepID=UPI002E1BD929|nr:CDP-glycerol glycerophosphotransferase family protein [Neobacillus cucumis]MED4224281.1 CDP-glycerol glycerophosphotransferase family protein [Neobacillus cucumis]
MKGIHLLDLNYQDGALTGILHPNTTLNEKLTFVFYNRELKIAKRLPAHVFKTDKQSIHFKLPLHTFDFPYQNDHIGKFNILVDFGEGKAYPLIIRSKPLVNKITYLWLPPIHNQQMAYFLIKGSRLSLIYGDPSKLLPLKKRDKTIIKDLAFNEESMVLSFSVMALFHSIKKLVLIERSSKTEWIQKVHLQDDRIEVDLHRFCQVYYNQPSRWDFYLEMVNVLGQTERSRLGTYDKEVAPKSKRYFASSKTAGVHLLTPYLTELNGLAIVINEPHHLANEKVETHVKVLQFNMQGSSIYGKVLLQLPEVQSFQVKSLILKYRSKTDHIEYPFPISEVKRTDNESEVSFNIDISSLVLQNYYWDFYLLLEVQNLQIPIRLRNPADRVRRRVNNKSVQQSYDYGNGYWVHPYVTAANTIALLYKVKETHETSLFYFKEKLAYFIYTFFKWYFDRKDIWLGFEKFADSAQDNGFYFFQYCYQQGKHKNFYYVIKKDSPDYDNLITMSDKVIHYMSFKYMIYLFAAKLLISSESKGHVYDIRVQKGLLKKALDRKRQVFLQHGVIALKRVDQVFKKSSKGAVDLFVVSSEHEKEIIKQNFGYREEEVIITGLSRWDVLTDQSQGKSTSTILLMPTWRSWMDDLPEEKFIQSEYYRQYESLLNSQDLDQLLEQYDIHLSFFIHPKFKAYIDQFTSENPRVKIYQFGDIQLNELLMQSSLLITDYSSVSWDMYYQKKPIIFYQFDLDDYLKYQGSYIDMEKDLFGDRTSTVDGLISLIKKYANRQYKEEDTYAFMRKKYLTYTDKQNSSRIYQEILNHKQQLAKKKRGLGLYESSLLRTIWAYSKKNELFFNFANYMKDLLIRR